MFYMRVNYNIAHIFVTTDCAYSSTMLGKIFLIRVDDMYNTWNLTSLQLLCNRESPIYMYNKRLSLNDTEERPSLLIHVDIWSFVYS